MKRIPKKKTLCLLLAVLLLCMAGCGDRTAKGINTDEKDGNSQEQSQEGGNDSGETAMGRYAEEELDLSEELEAVSGLKKFSDGRLMITDRFCGVWESTDQGRSWSRTENSWLDEKMGNAYFLDIQAADDGTLALIWEDSGEDEQAEDQSGEEEEQEPEADSLFRLDPECALLRPDGTEIPVTLSLEEEEGYPCRFWISDQGRIFLTTLGDHIYEVKEDGSTERFLTLDDRPMLVQFQGDLLIVDGYGFESPVLYDMEKKEYVEEPELVSFISENYGERSFNGGSWYDLYLFPGEEGALYLAGRKGLSRYVPGKESGAQSGEPAAEQLIDGKLSYLGNTRYALENMILLKGTGNGENLHEEFLSISSDGKLVRYTYDPEMPSVPERKLKIYSLEESWAIRTAVSTFQLSHPDVYAEYEIGMEGESGITREDALKKLNTQIMAGQGPDVLMLDSLPLDSYMEKGLLMDLDGLMEEFGKEEDLYENLWQALVRDGKLYAVPGEIYLPVVFGREEYVSNMKDLSSTADEIERIRQDNPGRDLLAECGEKGIMKMFAPVSAPLWKTADGEIDRQAVSEFLTQTKRIYEAQMDGLSEESLEMYRQSCESSVEYGGEDWMYDITCYGEEYLYYVAGLRQLSAGVTTSPYGYYGIHSIQKVKGFEDVIVSPMEGMCSGVYVPETLLGINAASGQSQLAEDFLKAFLGKEIQGALGGYGINKAALEENFTPEEQYVGENGEYSTVAISNGEGLEVQMDIYVATPEQMEKFKGWMESAHTPYLADFVLEKTVFEEGEKFFRGEQSLEETLDQIVQQMGIYLSE